MDKVKEILKKIQPHQFWILLAVALLLPVWGWWSTTSELVAKTKAREGTIKAAITSIPKPGERNANDYWIEGVRKTNEIQEAQLKKAWHELFDRQQKLISWPDRLGFTDPDKATDPDLARYNNRYPLEVESVRRIPNTVNGHYLEPGPVSFPVSAMPRAAWAGGQLPPTIPQMKNAQEDLWLLASLLRSVQRTNGDAKTPLKASVREIRKIQVRGGALVAAVAAAPPAEGGGEGPPRRMGEGGGGAPAAAAPTGAVNAGFDPGEEMGPDPEAGGGGRPGGGEGMPRGGEDGAPAAPAASKRYLEELPQAKKRGFYLEVVLEQSKLPELLVQLSRSEWPVRILHVNLAELRPDPLVPPADEGVPAAARMAAIKAAEAAGVNPAMGLPPGPGIFPPAGANRGGPPGIPGAGAAGVRPPGADDPAMADPYLAVAAISGYIVIYNPPPVPPAATGEQAGQTPVGQAPPGQNPAAVAPAGPAAPSAPANPAVPTPSTTGATKNSTPLKTEPTGVIPQATTTSPPADSKGTSTPAAPSKTGAASTGTPSVPPTKTDEVKPSSTNPDPPKK